MATFKKRSLLILSLFLLSILTVLPITPMVEAAGSVTLSNPTIDVRVQRGSANPYSYTRVNSPTDGLYFQFWIAAQQWGFRSYIEWDVSSIPDGATITAIELRYNGLNNNDASVPGKIMSMEGRDSDYADDGAGNLLFYTDCQDGTEFYSANAFPVVGTGKSVALASSAYADLQAHLAALDWWAIGITLNSGAAYKLIASENYVGANPTPTLYVEYDTNNPPVNNACDSTDIFYLGINGWVNVTVSDINLVADLKTVDIQVNTTGDAETFTLRWTQATGVFSEVSDISGICALGSGVRVNIDADTDKIAFQFQFTGGTIGFCDVKTTSTDDADETDIDVYPLEFLYTTSDANPSFVDTFTIGGGTNFPYQRDKFYANGRFWNIWEDGTNLVYSSSVDGTTWADKITIRAWYVGGSFATHFDGTYGHYVISDQATLLKYRRFTPNADGSITYSAAEQDVNKFTTYVYYPSITVDSSDYVWVGYRGYTGTWRYPCVSKSSNNDGTWGAGISWQLDSNDSTNSVLVSVISLTYGKVLAILAYTGYPMFATVWDGATWGTWAATITGGSTEIKYSFQFSAVAENDDAHLTFIKNVSYDLIYVKYDYSTNTFSVATTLQAGNSAISIPSITFDPITKNLYDFWSNYPTANHIFYRKYDSATAVWEARIDWITEPQAITWPNSFYNAYGTYIGINYYTDAGSPYFLKFAYLGFPTFSSNASILNMNADNWVFAEYKYYTFEANYIHAANWSLIDSMRVQFNDGDGLIQIQYRLSTAMYTVLSGDDKVVIRIISAENTSLTTYRITFGVYFTKNVVDTYNLELYTWVNSTIGETFYYEAATDYFNIYNLGGRTEYQEIGDESLSSHPVKSDPFDLQVIDGAGGDIAVNVTYRNLQQVSILTHLIIPADYIGSQYAGEWSTEYGIYYYADGSWTRGWNVVLEFSNGFISNKDFWVYCHSRWYRNNGVLVGGSEYFSSFFKPGLVNGTTVWVDLWFSNTNSSTAGAGRVSAEYYGMRDAAPWFAFWYSDWGPMLGNQTMSYYEMPLLNSTGGVISSRDVELVKVYSRLYKITSTSYTVEVKAPEVFDRKIARGDFTGIPTPPFVPPKVMDMPQGGMFGLLQTFLASIVAAITQALSPVFATCVALLDGIFAWAGWPGGFTQITTWINDLAGFMVSAMGWMMTLLTSIFGFFTTTVPSFLYIVTTALTTYIDMIGKFWGYFTGLFGTGFDIWNDFNGPQWVTIGILLYPLYLLTLWAERGLEPVLVHLDFWGGMIMGLINLAINLAGLVWSFISGLIENIPVVE